MQNLNSLPAQIILSNGALLILPSMIISFGLWGTLPAAYSPDIFWKEIPEWLGSLEKIFRVLVFGLPGILYFEKKEKEKSIVWNLYFGVLVVYLASYLAQIIFPTSVWSQSAIGFTAGAWTTIF